MNPYAPLFSAVGMAELVNSISKTLSLDRRASCTALYLFHKYTNTFINWKSSDLYYIAVSCVFLSCKAEECRRKCGDIVNALKTLGEIKIPDQTSYNLFKERVFQKERDVLDTIDFNFSIEHPHRFLMMLLKRVFGGDHNDSIKELAVRAWDLINLSMLIPLCIRYTPQSIAFACVLLADERGDKKILPGMHDLLKIVPDLPEPEVIQKIKDSIAGIYKKPS